MGRRNPSIAGSVNLSRLRRRAALGYWMEVLARTAAPPAGILASYLIAVLFGFGNPWACAGVLLLALAALGLGLSRLRRPGQAALDRRIERASGLRHRPLATLEDEPENDGPVTAAIWQIHQRRIAASLLNARAGKIFVDAVVHDPWALRGLLLLLLLAGVIIAGPQAIPRLAGAFEFPAWPFPAPSVNAWITPPSYTGAPPLVLQPGKTIPVLAGSRLTVVVDDEDHPSAVILGSKSVALGALAPNSFRADMVLTASANLRIGPWWHPLARWNFRVSPPDKPVITLTKPFIVDRQLILGWHASDRYGLESLSAVLTPVGHTKAPPEVLALPITGADPRHPSGVAKPDIGDSPFAGLAVSLLLQARNLPGMESSTAPVTLTLPPPELHDKTALALAGLRQQLALAPTRKQAVGDALSRLAQHPSSKVMGSADVQMAALAEALQANEIAASDAVSLLGTLEHQVELGPDYQPARALAAAAQALEQALQQSVDSGKPLDANRLQNLLAAMQSALAQHLQALAPKNSAPSNSAPMNAGDLNQLAEQIAEDEAAGQTAKAQAELQRLQQILSALQSAKPMSAADAARATAANQAAQALAKITQGESALLDQTNQGGATPASQSALRQQLDSTRQGLGQAGIPLPGLGDAAAAMGAAQTALARQDVSTAMGAEDGAIQGLQKAAAALAASSKGFGFDAGEAGAAPGSLENGASGAPDENAIPSLLPSSGNEAGIIQQQIIKNDSSPALPEATHQYYHRLLNSDGP